MKSLVLNYTFLITYLTFLEACNTEYRRFRLSGSTNLSGKAAKTTPAEVGPLSTWRSEVWLRNKDRKRPEKEGQESNPRLTATKTERGDFSRARLDRCEWLGHRSRRQACDWCNLILFESVKVFQDWISLSCNSLCKSKFEIHFFLII